MVISGALIMEFFKEIAQTEIINATILQLPQEGIENVDDIVDFEKDILKHISNILRHPRGQASGTNPGVISGVTIQTILLAFGVKSQICVLAACDLVRYYEAVGQELTPVGIQ